MAISAELIDRYITNNTPFEANASYLQRLKRFAKIIGPSDDQKCHYCYIYLDPRHPGNYRYTLPSGKVVRFKFKPFYVGKGKNGRKYAHLWGHTDTRNTKKHNTIRKLAALGLEPIVKNTRVVSENLAFAFEVDLIAGIGRSHIMTGPLSNLTAGGEGTTGYRHTAATKKLISKASKGNQYAVGKMSDRGRQNISRSLKGIPKSEAHRIAAGLARRGIKPSETTTHKMRLAKLGKPWTAARRAAQNAKQGE